MKRRMNYSIVMLSSNGIYRNIPAYKYIYRKKVGYKAFYRDRQK